MSKNRVIVEAVLAGQSHGAVARQYGISTVWVGKLVARWRSGGWDALAKQSTRPKSNPNATGQDVIARVIALRQELTDAGLDAGPHTLHAHLQDTGLQVPSVTTIWRILTREGLVTPEPRKRPKRSYLRFEADLPNECWQSDFTHWPLADGTDTEILTWLDDHARYALSLTAHTPVTGEDVVTTFRAAVDPTASPPPPSPTTDWCSPPDSCTAPTASNENWSSWASSRRTADRTTPKPKGKVERFQQTLKKWLRAQPPAGTLTDLQAQLDAFPRSTTPPDRTDHWATAPPRRSTPRARRPPPPAGTGTGGSATTRSTRPGASPCATADACTTSAWATNTTTPPCGSSSTTCTSPSSTPTPARSSAT